MDIHANRLRVGLLGYGYSGKTFHAPLVTALPDFELVAVSSRDAARVRADLPDIAVHAEPLAVARLDSIDLVIIATPNDTHAPLARAALDAGKHVVIDKPFTIDLAEARDLIALAERRNTLLSVFHNRRWDSDFLTIRQAIADGLAGEVSHFESHFDRFRPHVRDRWRERDGPGSGIWFDLGPHLADQALQLFGLPDLIQASLAGQRAGSMADDWAHVLLHYGERRVVLHAGMLVAGGTSRFIAHGTAGSLVKRRADRQEQQLLDGIRPGEAGWGEDPDPLLVYDSEGNEHPFPAIPGDQRRYYAGIADALRGKVANPAPPIQALAAMAVVVAAIESAKTHASVALSMTAEERAAWQSSV
jgi:predicted dehydrogenase